MLFLINYDGTKTRWELFAVLESLWYSLWSELSLSVSLCPCLAFLGEAQGQVWAVLDSQLCLSASVPMWPSFSMWVYPVLWRPHAAHLPFDICTYIFPKWTVRMQFGTHSVRRRSHNSNQATTYANMFTHVGIRWCEMPLCESFEEVSNLCNLMEL